MAFQSLIALSRCRQGAGTFVSHGEHELAVFRFGDPERVLAIDNACPHAGGNLSGGKLDGTIVTCPWHQWPFDLSTGECTHSPLARVKSYPTEIRDGMIWVDLS